MAQNLIGHVWRALPDLSQKTEASSRLQNGTKLFHWAQYEKSRLHIHTTKAHTGVIMVMQLNCTWRTTVISFLYNQSLKISIAYSWSWILMGALYGGIRKITSVYHRINLCFHCYNYFLQVLWNTVAKSENSVPFHAEPSNMTLSSMFIPSARVPTRDSDGCCT